MPIGVEHHVDAEPIENVGVAVPSGDHHIALQENSGSNRISRGSGEIT